MHEEDSTVAESIANPSAALPASSIDASISGTVALIPEPAMPVPAVVGNGNGSDGSVSALTQHSNGNPSMTTRVSRLEGQMQTLIGQVQEIRDQQEEFEVTVTEGLTAITQGMAAMTQRLDAIAANQQRADWCCGCRMC